MFSSAFALSTTYQRLSDLLYTAGFRSSNILDSKGYLFNRDTSITLTVTTGDTIPTGLDGITMPARTSIPFDSGLDTSKVWIKSASDTPTIEIGVGITAPAIPSTTNTLGAATGTSLAVAGALTSSSPSAGIGYATGAGSTVTQGTSRTTGVTINAKNGEITLVSAAGSTTPASFTVTNSAMGATDHVILNQKSGTDKYELDVTAKADGSFQITFNTKSGTTTEQPVISFAIFEGVSA